MTWFDTLTHNQTKALRNTETGLGLLITILLSLETRYLKRRNSNVISLAKFFVNPDSLTDTEDTYKMPSKTISTKECQFVVLIVDIKLLRISVCERMSSVGDNADNLTPGHEGSLKMRTPWSTLGTMSTI